MTSEGINPDQERIGASSFSPPAVELLLEPNLAEPAWPQSVINNPAFREQVEGRRAINAALDAVVSALPRPDISLQEAITEKYITEEQAADLYESLVELLGDVDYKRALLYMPFEFLPQADWAPSSAALGTATERFRSAYMSAWYSLLKIHDVRANFVDGDVLDVESRTSDLPRVVKAAHLIPKLVESGFMKVTDVIALRESTEDELLKQNIGEALLVLADLGFVTDSVLAEPTVSAGAPKNVGDIPVSMTQKRVAWLAQEKKRLAMLAAAKEFTDHILSKAPIDETVVDQQTFVLGVRDAIEILAKSDFGEAKKLYEQYGPKFLELWQNAAPEVHEALVTAFHRLHASGIVGQEQIAALGITPPALAGPFSKNLLSMAEEMKVIREIAASIESDPELSPYIYLAVLIYGSRLKGYGAASADIDIGMFVKPGAPFADRAKLQAVLKAKFSHEKIHGEVVEFWLEETEAGLAVRDFDETDSFLGASHWTHVLFGAAVEGDKQAISELREKLLIPYFTDTKRIMHGRPARALYIEELERDTLQYRLMHKGYARFAPPRGGMQTPHANQIDGESMFWDSGYRQTALKLFASRVFLPKIVAEKV